MSLKQLKNDRGIVKGKLSRFTTFLSNYTDERLDELQLRLEAFALLLQNFEKIQSEIDSLDTAGTATEDNLLERENFENNYYAALTKAKHLTRPRVTSTPINDFSTRSVAEPRIKLPQLNLTMFSGKFEEWNAFSDNFKSIVHNNVTLTDSQKFQYLKAQLTDNAAQAVNALEITDANYAIAWEILLQRFENKPLAAEKYLQNIFDIQGLTKESPTFLRNLYDTLVISLRGLNALGISTQNWDFIIIYIIKGKLDNTSRREWALLNSKTEMPTTEQLTNFLRDRCTLLERMQLQTKQGDANKSKSKLGAYVSVQSVAECLSCKGTHYLHQCETFKANSVNERKALVNKLRLCFNCLRKGHRVNQCKSQSCFICKKRHHTLIHEQGTPPTTETNGALPTDAPAVTSTVQGGHVCTNAQVSMASSAQGTGSQVHVLLSTATVRVSGVGGQTRICKILLDSGSQANFITERLCDELNLRKTEIHSTITGVGASSSQIRFSTTVTLQSRQNNYKRVVNCFVLNEITGKMPTCAFDSSILQIPADIELADEYFNESREVEVLVGASEFWNLMIPEQRHLGRNMPILHNSHFGWILSGPLSIKTTNNRGVKPATSVNCALLEELSKFWQIEEVEPAAPSSNEQICESMFLESTRRDVDGRFVVEIPFKKNTNVLGDSRKTALKRFNALENKLQRDTGLKTRYVAFMTEYEQLGHMTKVNELTNANEVTYYIPHHGVTKIHSGSSKHRTVFDASAKTDAGPSLNDIQHVGPVVQEDLFSILVRFRKHRYALTADIEKMYRQISLTPDQRNLQRIFWRSNPNDELICYTLNTVTYGMASSPYLATRCLKQLSIECQDSEPDASDSIRSDFYVDDYLSGASTIAKAVELRENVTKILKAAHFNLTKWVSNDPRIAEPGSMNITSRVISLNEADTNKTLGLLWNPDTDKLHYEVIPFTEGAVLTKRMILSHISKLFDPLQILAPIIISAKLIMQSLWLNKLGWDEPICDDLKHSWIALQNELSKIREISVPRFVSCEKPKLTELHGFCDASARAYGACVYLRTVDISGTVKVSLITAKSRVAPLKTLTIPRLELCGALLSAKLVNRVSRALKMESNDIHFWTDSTIVLDWLNSDSNRWKTFVANRVAQVQSLTQVIKWHHVATHANPADLVSRGCSVRDLLSSGMWFDGPEFLRSNNGIWLPYRNINRSKDCPEQKIVASALPIVIDDFDLVTQYSSLSKLLNVTAYCLRFMHNARRNSARISGTLSAGEVKNALKALVGVVQKKEFSDEIGKLSRAVQIKSTSKLLALNPFLDKEGILRVGGRISNADLPYNNKHQVLLPAKHHLTRLIARHAHITNMHCGPQALLYCLRQRYWPVGGRNLVKQVFRECMRCFRALPRREQYKMGDLPVGRVIPTPPFFECGIDYLGPFMVKERMTRGAKTVKAYACLFVCFSTKAVHLELVSSLTSEAFIATLRRFVARRGSPNVIHSDNATNFVGANKELTKLALLSKGEENRNFLLEHEITWKFIPARSPTFGGLWERNVGSIKSHLKRVSDFANLNFEEFNTLLTQVEAIMNSRPLSPMSPSPEDLSPLTPGHFLIGRPLTAVADSDLLHTTCNRLSRFQLVQRLSQHFWQRWQREYLGELQQRSRWKRDSARPVVVGDLVVLHDDGLPACKWRLGRIIDLHPGSDGVVRVVTLRTESGTTKRGVGRVSVLPVQ